MKMCQRGWIKNCSANQIWCKLKILSLISYWCYTLFQSITSHMYIEWVTLGKNHSVKMFGMGSLWPHVQLSSTNITRPCNEAGRMKKTHQIKNIFASQWSNLYVSKWKKYHEKNKIVFKLIFTFSVGLL
jgi:hypothetical protein